MTWISLVVLCVASAGSAEEAWQAVAQPDLKQALDNAPELPVENLGTAVYGVDVCGTNLVPNPDGKSYDVLVWYRKAYRTKTRVYIVDLGSGQITKQEFKEEEDRARVEMAFTWWGVYGFDGLLYGAITDQKTWGTGGIMRIYRYDPAKNRVELYKKIKGHGGERNPMALSPNGWIYGAGSWLGKPDWLHRASAYGFNPATGEVRNYGAIGPRIDGTAFGYSMGVCDTHIYVACGKIPWYLVAVDIKTGEDKVLLKAPEGGDIYVNSNAERYFGGAVCYVQPTNDPAGRKYYWLYHGRAIAKKTPGWEMDDSCPWPAQVRARSPMRTRPTPPEIHTGQLYPDDDDRAILWWRPGVAPGQRQTEKWRKVVLEGVEKHPLALHRLCNLPDGRLFGTGHGYKGRFLFDPTTGKVTYLGDGGGSLYALAVCGDKLYWSGYSLGLIFEFDPARAWNLHVGGPPGHKMITTSSPEAFGPNVNPRRVHKDRDAVFRATRVKKMLCATTAADGRIYFGGKGQRDYAGGSLAWYDPATGKIGGLWKPFRGQDIGWVTTAVEGRYVVIGTEGGKAYIYDTKTHELLLDKTFTPVPGSDKSGPILEVAPGRMLGLTWQGRNPDRGVIYGVEIPSGKVFFRKKIPYGIPFHWAQGTRKWDYRLGPDGFVWATLSDGRNEVLVRIDPKDARVHVLGKVSPLGKMAFVGKDLYLTGTEQLRRLKNIVP